MHTVELSPKVFYQRIQEYQEAQLLFAGIRLDVFSHLQDYSSPGEVAAHTGYHERNLRLFLNSLASIGLLDMQNGRYKNKPAADEYLNRNSDTYLGDYILFRERMTGLEHVEERVRNGPVAEVEQSNDGLGVYDFYTLAKLTAREMYTGRVQSFLKAAECLLNKNEPVKVLDLSGGPGVMAIELIKNYPGAEGVVFEHPEVARVPEETVKAAGLEGRIGIVAGDFLSDDIGKHYDLIIASGILDFAKENINSMADKLYRALKPSGYLYLVSHDVSEDFLSPKESIVGWLSGQLDGLNVLLCKTSIDSALMAAGFESLNKDRIAGMMNNLQGEFYVKGQGNE